jgi:hypothetical protein
MTTDKTNEVVAADSDELVTGESGLVNGATSPPIGNEQFSDMTVAMQSATPVYGVFCRPVVQELSFLHALRSSQGLAVLRLRILGWGRIKIESRHQGRITRQQISKWSSMDHQIVFLAPHGAEVRVVVWNVLGKATRSLTVLPSNPALVVPAVPAVPSIRRIRVIPRASRQFSPSFAEGLKPGFNRLAALHESLLKAQALRRQTIPPVPSAITVPPIDLASARDRLRAWMIEVHHGPDSKP